MTKSARARKSTTWNLETQQVYVWRPQIGPSSTVVAPAPQFTFFPAQKCELHEIGKDANSHTCNECLDRLSFSAGNGIDAEVDSRCQKKHIPLRKRVPEPKNEVSGAGESSSLTSTQEWLTTREAAAYLGLSPGSLLNMTSNGEIPHYKLGRRNRYRVADLRELLLAQKRGGSI